MTSEYIVYIGIAITVVIGLAGEYQMRGKRRNRK